MSSATAEFPGFEPPPPDEEQSAFMRSSATIQETRLEFLNACDHLSEKPDVDALEVVNLTVNDYCHAMAGHLNLLCAGLSASQLAAEGRDFLTIEDGQRIDFLNGLMGKPLLGKLQDDGSFAKLQSDLQKALDIYVINGSELEAKNQVLGVLAQCFADSITTGQKVFLEHFLITRLSKLKRIGSVVGKHALDVGKTAIGTAAGMAIIHLLNSSRSRR